MNRLFSCVTRTLLVVLAVCAPRLSEAAPINLGVTFVWSSSYASLEFGPEIGLARTFNAGFLDAGDRLVGPQDSFEIAGGTIELISGPLIDVTPFLDDAVYTHAPGGTFALEFDLRLPNGSFHHGTFSAPLGQFVIYADAEGGGGRVAGSLGPGLFDLGTARLLHIDPRTLFSPYGGDFHLDSYDSYPAPYRVAKGFGQTELVAVAPEPSATWLIGLGVGVLARRRARRQCRISSTEPTEPERTSRWPGI